MSVVLIIAIWRSFAAAAPYGWSASSFSATTSRLVTPSPLRTAQHFLRGVAR